MESVVCSVSAETRYFCQTKFEKQFISYGIKTKSSKYTLDNFNLVFGNA